MKSTNFRAITAKMDALKESEQGKLKGGIRVLIPNNSDLIETTNICQANPYRCRPSEQQ